jgi:hypothetical protein
MPVEEFDAGIKAPPLGPEENSPLLERLRS